MCACDAYDPSWKDDLQQKCQDFVDNVKTHMPTFLQKQKTHLILHLVECMDEFGPTSSFNAERYVYHILLLVPARPTPSPGLLQKLACLLTKDLGHIHLLQYRFESFNSKVWMFNIFSNRQASSRDIASRLQSLMHISQSNSVDGNKRFNTQYETRCCKGMFFLGLQLER